MTLITFQSIKLLFCEKREKKLSIQAEFANVIGLVPAARAWECIPGKRLAVE